ncbi:MAG TPA: hypothetical protein VHL80_13740 [Polyangia bacterium]|nr:hypothetical protein [Polyangia bacterium]
MAQVDDRKSAQHPRADWRRTLAAILSAMIVSAVVWGIVVFFDVR